MADILNDANFERFRKLIYDESGITFSETNRPVLDGRIKEILRANNIATVEDYYKIITTDHEELKMMLDSVTTNLTRFFRNQPHFDAFVNYVIPHVLEEKKKTGNRHIKIWSAGCSTGEEPYTIAMILKKILPLGYTFSITASDLSLKSLMVGQRGFYAKNRVDGIPEDYLNEFFSKSNDGYQVNKDIMDCVKFDYHNLKHDSGMKNLDVVFCRNVLIYFDEAAQLEVINHFWDAMAPRSYLYIGHSESLFGMKTKFEFLKTNWACLYQKNL